MRNGIETDPVVIGGMTPLTTIDYPGELAAVLFLQGCPWRCGYCHNGALISRKANEVIPWGRIIELLDRRRNLLDAVVFSGGEPTLHSGLAEAIKQVRSMGFKIGLHTAGIYPRRLEKLLQLVDWVGMDVKSARADYDRITGVAGSATRAWQSIEAILQSGVAHEFRTTVHPDLLCEARLAALVNELEEVNAGNYAIQECVTARCLDESLRQLAARRSEEDFYQGFADRFDRFTLRRHGLR